MTIGLILWDVAPDIRQMRVPLDTGIDHNNVYLVREDPGWCVFDTGMDSQAVRDIWTAALSGPLSDGISRIVVSHHHPDHLGLAAWLQDTTGAPVYVRPEELRAAQGMGLADPAAETAARNYFSRNGMPAADVERTIEEQMRSFYACAIPRDTRTVEHGQRMTVGRYAFEALVAGGHSVAQIALYDPAGKILLGGDQMLEWITSNVGLWPFGDRAPLGNHFRALDEIAARDIRVVLPGHHNVYRTDGSLPEKLRAHHQKMLSTVRAGLKERMTGFEIAQVVFGRQHDLLNRILALVETLAHLQWLEGEGSVARHDGPRISYYERVTL